MAVYGIGSVRITMSGHPNFCILAFLSKCSFWILIVNCEWNAIWVMYLLWGSLAQYPPLISVIAMRDMPLDNISEGLLTLKTICCRGCLQQQGVISQNLAQSVQIFKMRKLIVNTCEHHIIHINKTVLNVKSAPKSFWRPASCWPATVMHFKDHKKIEPFSEMGKIIKTKRIIYTNHSWI